MWSWIPGIGIQNQIDSINAIKILHISWFLICYPKWNDMCHEIGSTKIRISHWTHKSSVIILSFLYPLKFSWGISVLIPLIHFSSHKQIKSRNQSQHFLLFHAQLSQNCRMMKMKSKIELRCVSWSTRPFLFDLCQFAVSYLRRFIWE